MPSPLPHWDRRCAQLPAGQSVIPLQAHGKHLQTWCGELPVAAAAAPGSAGGGWRPHGLGAEAQGIPTRDAPAALPSPP